MAGVSHQTGVRDEGDPLEIDRAKAVRAGCRHRLMEIKNTENKNAGKGRGGLKGYTC